ncbi:hypothetical protein BGW36DRAFT_402321 [Talaromyces proteolyticus]|uniref:DUF7605 domain-containing protein n=1 Tax=Talaromyces proteolyticus TaxID=1131652 RepID=A0AAD4KHW5_9EURO|nr:uncharacterized protein BGW36DRAFT_402321 [Talaromyces proteolyticus]KAH8688822.1 hypothetical protein BGW36DRAFT_402321 [Talaromyces proteolyticus]
MSDIQTDAFSPIRTSIIGQLMEADYNAANMEYGRGSDRRRKTIISSGFRSRSLFVDHRRRLRSQFISISEELQQETTDAVAQQLRFIETDLNTLRNENVVLESERNPEFRTRLELEVTQAREEMGTVRAAINDLFNSTLEDTVMDE